MSEEKEVKIDKRILYTRMVIKNALLEEMKSKAFNSIGVVHLCDLAQISRSAFYLHYKSINDVLDEIVREALDDEREIVYYILGKYGTKNLEKGEKATGIDKQIVKEQYNVLIRDVTAIEKIIEIVSEKYKKDYVLDICKSFGISKDDAEIIFKMQIGGFLFSIQESKGASYKKAKHIRMLVDSILESGIKGLSK